MFLLTRHTTSVEESIADSHQWPLRVTAQVTEGGVSSKIFVMRMDGPPDLLPPSLSCVASVQQLLELPEDEPNDDSIFFRVATFETPCRNPDLAEELWLKIQYAVQSLADNVAASRRLSVAETVPITPEI